MNLTKSSKWDKIIKEDNTVDLYGFPKYEMAFTKRSPVYPVYGYEAILPEPPPDEQILNYGLPIDQQIFRYTYIPSDLKKWTVKERDEFIDGEYFRRLHGIWMFIKGKKYYITGVFYFFLNYWTSTSAPRMVFRKLDLDFFIMWFLAVHDPKCYGLLVAKCRQCGETEKSICILYEFATRVKKVKCPMQSINETDIYENAYKRILHAHNEMIFYMRATNRGSVDPKDGLFFDYQRETLSKEKMKKNQEEHGVAAIINEEYEYPPLDSSIVYGATKPHVFGTGTFGRYYMDEWGKMEQMNPLYAWGVVKQAMYNKITNEILGKALFTSTVEELRGGETLRVAKQMWAQSDPNNRKTNGETLTGLYRIFRGSLDAAPIDAWGFPKIEEAKERNRSEIAMRISQGDIKGKIEYMRMNAETIEDVFQNTNEGSQFDIEKLEKRHHYVLHDAPKSVCVRGNLKWLDDKRDTQVIWEPNSKGKWMISKHPNDFGVESNAKVKGVIAPKPANINIFKAGLDPYEQQSTLEAEPSMGGICVKRVLDEFIDGHEHNYYQANDPEGRWRAGDPVDGGHNFITNRIVCDYLFRENDPNDFFEDVILTMVYYGTDFLPEKDRFGACHSYIKTRGYELYLMEKPTDKKNARGQQEREGVSATIGNIDSYFSFLTTLSAKWAGTIDHPRVLEQLKSMNWANRGKKDLGVACGWAEFAANQPRSTVRKQIAEQTTHFQEYAV